MNNIVRCFILVAALTSWPVFAGETAPFPFPATLSVYQNGKIGEVLTSGWISVNAPEIHGNSRTEHAVGIAAAPPLVISTVQGPHGLKYDVFKTSVDGVGLAMGMGIQLNGGAWHWGAATPTLHQPITEYLPAKSGDSLRTVIYGALVRTGDIRQGGTPMPMAAEYGLMSPASGSEGEVVTTRYVFLGKPTQINVTQYTCKIETSDVRVNMGDDISLSGFKRVGDTSAQKTLQLKMTCPAGIPKLQYQFAPAGGSSDLGNGTLSLSNPGGASGVGVQITRWQNQDPIPLNQSVPMGWYHPDRGGEMDPAWSVRYIQTGDHVKGGEADAKATFTLSYQ